MKFKKLNHFPYVGALFLMVLLVQLSFAYGITNLGFLYSMEVDGYITLDGKFEDEWLVTEYETYTTYCLENDTKFCETTIMSVYDSTSIYFGISTNLTDSDSLFYIMFQVNNSANLFTFENNAFNWNDGNDAKMLNAATNETSDFVSAFGSPASDTQNGGSNNVEGNCWSKSNSVNYEFKFPLDSGDQRGADVALRPGSTINFFILLYSPQDNENYSFLKLDGDWGFVALRLEGFTIPSYSIPLLIVCIVSMSAILMIEMWRKKRIQNYS